MAGGDVVTHARAERIVARSLRKCGGLFFPVAPRHPEKREDDDCARQQQLVGDNPEFRVDGRKYAW